MLSNIDLHVADGFLTANPYLTFITKFVDECTQLQGLEVKLNLFSEFLVGNRKATLPSILFSDDFLSVTINIPFQTAYLTVKKSTKPPSVSQVLSSIKFQLDKAEVLYQEHLINNSSNDDLKD